jgi:hypothetical protein
MSRTVDAERLTQYIVSLEDGQYIARLYVGQNSVRGVVVAAHRKIEAVRLAIPTTHIKAPYPQERPMVEVWIDKAVAP